MIIEYIPDFLSSVECNTYRNMIDNEIQNEKVWLKSDPCLLDLFTTRLLNTRYKTVGKQVTLGKYTNGQYLGRHADHPYQGDSTSVLLIYLNTVLSGGETVFYENMMDQVPLTYVKPREGMAIIFDILQPHEASPVHDYKYIMGCELRIEF